MPKLAKRLGLDLPDAFASDVEVLPNLFESVVRAFADPEAHPKHARLARGQGRKHLSGLLGEVRVNHRVLRTQRTLVFDEIRETAEPKAIIWNCYMNLL